MTFGLCNVKMKNDFKLEKQNEKSLYMRVQEQIHRGAVRNHR